MQAQAGGDPTKVVGRRVGGYLIDLVLIYALQWGVLLALGLGDGLLTFSTDSTGNATFEAVDGGRVAAYYAISFALWFGDFAVLQGITGASVGMHAVGVRVVRKTGEACGIWRAFLRNLLFIVDAIPFCIPYLLGFVFMASRDDHRRVGDLAAGTWVVHKDAFGAPVGQFKQQWGYGQAYAPGAAPGGPGTGGPPPIPGGYGAPQWDQGHNAWIQYDGRQWMRHDGASQRWTPI